MPNKALSFRSYARIPLDKFLKIKRLIEKSNSLFNVTLYSYKKPIYDKELNVDALYVELDHLVKSQKRGLRGYRQKYIDLVERFGYKTTSAAAVPGVSSLTATSITATTATADWADYTGAEEYEVFVYNGTGTSVLQGPFYVTASQRALTGLTAETQYQVKVRPLWNNRNEFGSQASHTFTTDEA